MWQLRIWGEEVSSIEVLIFIVDSEIIFIYEVYLIMNEDIIGWK
jgi:hypothetical protein